MKDRLVQKLKKHDEKSFEIIMEHYARFVATIINNIAKGSGKPESVITPQMHMLIMISINRIIGIVPRIDPLFCFRLS